MQKSDSIAPELVESYRQDGFLIVRNLYDPTVMSDWKRKIIEIMRADGTINDPVGVRVWQHEALDSELLRGMADPKVVCILQALTNPCVEFLSGKAVFKSADTDFASPWHHDWAYWKGTHKISIWIALDPADRSNGCLKMIPGSHRKAMKCNFTEEGIGFGWRVDQAAVDRLPLEVIEVSSGDAVFFHDLTVHASYPNTAKKDSWSFIATYRDASIPDESTVWKSGMPVT